MEFRRGPASLDALDGRQYRRYIFLRFFVSLSCSETRALYMRDRVHLTYIRVTNDEVRGADR
jgi:hypothetical protein